MSRHGHLRRHRFVISSGQQLGGGRRTERGATDRAVGAGPGALWVVSEALDVLKPHLPVGFGVWMP